MSRSTFDHNDLERLLSCLADGHMADSEWDQLRHLLRSSPEAREAYVAYMELHAALELTFALPLPDPPTDILKPALPLAEPRSRSVGASPILGFLGRLSRVGSSMASAAVLVRVAVVMGAGAVLAAALMWLSHDGHMAIGRPKIAQGKTEEAPPAQPDKRSTEGIAAVSPAPLLPPAAAHPVARLTRLTNCRWTGVAAVMKCGAALAPGQRIDLAAGEAEIAFDSGVVVVLFGPGILEVESPKKAELLMGHAMARAETAAGHGFVLATRTAAAIDLGTEFHVQAAADGHSEIYVTRGAVEVTAGNDKGKRRIEAGQVAQVEPGSAGIIAVIESGQGTMAFKFPTIEPPSNRDYADASQRHATIRAEGKLAPDSGPPAVLLDGHAQSKADSPGESCFFADNEQGRFVLDLGKPARIHKVNTYSWHAFAGAPTEHDRYDVRATQRYDLYGCAGDAAPAAQGSPAEHGWTLISRVNTDEYFSVPPVKNRPVQQAVSITAANGDVGRYRFLLWNVKPTHVKALPPHGPENDENTFFGELDVYAE